MRNLMVAIITLVALVGCQKSTVPTKSSIVILVDRTVDDRNSLDEKLMDAGYEVLRKIKSKRHPFLNRSINVHYLDSAGEASLASSSCSIEGTKTFGKKRKKIKKIEKRFILCMKLIRNEIRESGVYKRSLLVEGIANTLKNNYQLYSENGALNEVYIVSDMAVVSARQNFEKSQFSRPLDLHKYSGTIHRKLSDDAASLIHIKRVRRVGQTLSQIETINAWWSSTLEGTTDFSDLLEKAKNRDAQSHKKIVKKKVTKKKVTKKKVTKKKLKRKTSIRRKVNIEKKISKSKRLFKGQLDVRKKFLKNKCAGFSYFVDDESVMFVITVNRNGKPIKVAIDGVSRETAEKYHYCLVKTVGNIKFKNRTGAVIKFKYKYNI